MKKTLGRRIDWSNLEQRTVYRVLYKPLGEVFARLVNKEKLEFEITEGRLQSQADRRKVWAKGDTFTVDYPNSVDFYEVM